MLTQERLRELLHYDPDSGIFTNRISRGRAKAGTVSGCFDVGGPKGGYINIKIDNVLYKAHRLAYLYMFDHPIPVEVDHKNHIRHDNRWVNLRSASRQDNATNASRYKTNTSGITGVRWYTSYSKWVSVIGGGKKGKHRHIGYFTDFFEAICARKSAEIKYGFHPNHGK